MDLSIMEKIIVQGDLSSLKPDERLIYYTKVCESVGLNPLTKPFDYLKLDGKLVLYAKRDATDQLRKVHNISITITSREKVGDVYCVTARGVTPDNRTDESIGAVSLMKEEKIWDEMRRTKVATGRVLPLTADELANAIMKAECVPLDSEILTINGFKRYSEVHVGDMVLAYDCEKDVTVWTPLQKISVFQDSEISKLKSQKGQFEVLCTPDHSWAVKRSNPYKPDKRGDGSRGARGQYNNRGSERALIKAHELKSSHRIILAAKESATHTSLLSPDEAAVLGWAVTDGTIQRKGNFVRIGICQSKVNNFDRIRTIVASLAGEIKEHVTPARMRTFPTGKSYKTLEQHWWYLPSKVSRALLEKAGYQDNSDLPRIVTRLSSEARESMLEAFMCADGDKRGNFAKSKPEVIEAFQILCTLEGIAIGKELKRPHVSIVRKKKARHLAVSYLNLEPAGKCDVWCPTTQYGTWVMRQGGRVTITGNTKAKRRVTLSLSGLGMMDDSEIDTVENAERIIVDDVGNGKQLQEKSQPSAQSSKTNKKEKPANKPSAASQQTEQASTTNAASEVYKLLDYDTGTSPGGVTYAKMKVANVATGEESIMIANTPVTLEQTKAISNNSQFKIHFEMVNGFKIVKSVVIVGEAA